MRDNFNINGYVNRCINIVILRVMFGTLQRRKCDCDAVPKNVHILDHNFRFSNMDKLTVTLSIDAIRTTTPQHIRYKTIKYMNL